MAHNFLRYVRFFSWVLCILLFFFSSSLQFRLTPHICSDGTRQCYKIVYIRVWWREKKNDSNSAMTAEFIIHIQKSTYISTIIRTYKLFALYFIVLIHTAAAATTSSLVNLHLFFSSRNNASSSSWS